MNQWLVVTIWSVILWRVTVSVRQLEEPQNQFLDLLISGRFIDKSPLVEVVMEMPKRILVTTPRGWGKTTNLEMIRKFVEVEVDEEGLPRCRSSAPRSPVNNTHNYLIFTSNRLKITKHKYTMRRFFGKFPVIYADFKSVYKITNSDNAAICFRDIVHRAYKEHRYLRKSGVLTAKEKRLVTQWSDNGGYYEKFYGQDVTNSLYKLSRILYRHFRRKVFVLVDNYDHPSTNAMYEVKDKKEMNRITMFNMGIISKLVSEDNVYIRKAIIAGISYVMVAGIQKVVNLHTYRFLENHALVQYFGFTKPEVDHLCKRLGSNLTSAVVSSSHAFYGGYSGLNGQTVFNLRSVVEFVETGAIRRYKSPTGIFQNLKQLFRLQVVRDNIDLLVKGGEMGLDTSENITVGDVMGLRNFVIVRKSDERFNTNLIFYFLLEQGFLSFGPTRNTNNTYLTTIKIPNLEIKTMFAIKLKDYYDGIYGLDQSILRRCAGFFDDFTPSLNSNHIQLQRTLYWFFRAFEEFIWNTKNHFRKLCLFDIPRMVFSMMYQVNVRGNNGAFVSVKATGDYLNFLISREKLKFHLSLSCNKSSNIALQQVINLQDTDADVKRYVFIGLGVDSDLHPSISCLSNSKDVGQAIHIPIL